MQKIVRVERVEVSADGIIGVLMKKCIIDGDFEISRDWHRTLITPGTDPEAQLAAVNAHLTAMTPPWPAVQSGDWDDVLAAVASKHTPEFVAEWQAAHAPDQQPT